LAHPQGRTSRPALFRRMHSLDEPNERVVAWLTATSSRNLHCPSNVPLHRHPPHCLRHRNGRRDPLTRWTSTATSPVRSLRPSSGAHALLNTRQTISHLLLATTHASCKILHHPCQRLHCHQCRGGTGRVSAIGVRQGRSPGRGRTDRPRYFRRGLGHRRTHPCTHALLHVHRARGRLHELRPRVARLGTPEALVEEKLRSMTLSRRPRFRQAAARRVFRVETHAASTCDVRSMHLRRRHAPCDNRLVYVYCTSRGPR